MAERGYFNTPFAIGNSEFDLCITYVIHPGCPAWGGGRFEPPTNPPEEASVEILEVEMTASTNEMWAPKTLGTGAKVKEIPDWLFEMICDEFEDEIMQTHDDGEGDRADYLRDQQIDRELMEGR